MAKKKKTTRQTPPKKKLSRARKPDDMTLEQWQIALRREFARSQEFLAENIGDHPVFSEFAVTNPATQRTYRVAIRAPRLGANYCSCPDFAVNALGTCKHIEWMLWRLSRKPSTRRQLIAGFTPAYSEVYLRYGSQRCVVFAPGTDAPQGLLELASKYFDEDGALREDAYAEFDAFLKQARRFEHDLRCYDDTLAFVAEKRDAERRRRVIEARYRRPPSGRPARIPVKAKLYPFQREGALFAAEAGRAILADDMGLGKTVQAIAAARIMAKEFGVERTLVICPASLKHQWKSEIEKFTACRALVVEGAASRRQRQYEQPADFVIANYDIVLRDMEAIRRLAPDLVILDEAQRIKNWQTLTAKSVKRIQSPYALVLTGTPLENRLEELHSIVEFVDRHRLGPLFQFLHRHQIVDPDTQKVVGYQRLKEISQTLAPILLRRTRSEVLRQLPERVDKNFFLPMTRIQRRYHEDNRTVVARIVAKWRKHQFLSEADRRRLLIALQNMRMACDNAYLLDQKTHAGPKLDELMTLLGEILERPDTKVVVFSQWTRMNDLVARRLEEAGVRYVYLHGGVPAAKRKELLRVFRDDPDARVFLSTDAGGVGLNLQSASVVVNLDLPWNPAVLEQRVGRVHRLGQDRPVRVVNFISEHTIEHGMLNVLAFKQSLFAGVLEGGEDMVFVGDSKLKQFIKAVDTVVQAAPAPAADEAEAPKEAPARAPSTALPSAAAPLLEAGVNFLNELAAFASQSEDAGDDLRSLVETDPATERPYVRVPLPEPQVLEALAAAAAALLDALKAAQEPRP